MDTPLGTLRTVEGKPVLRFERRLSHPPHKVWKAITDPAEMAAWFPAAIDTELKVGAAMRFSFDEEFVDTSEYEDGEILELDPPRVYAFRWTDSALRFELIPEADGCRLVFTHTLGGAGSHGDLPSASRHATGWDACLALLTARLDGGPQPSAEGWFLPRAERYVEEFGLGDGEIRDDGDGWLLRFERDLVHPAEAVWDALVDAEEPRLDAPPPARLAHGYLDPRHGYLEAGPTTVLEPPRVLEYVWLHDGEQAGRVRFEIRGTEQVGTRLIVTQTIPTRLADTRATALAAWHTHMELFFAALHGDVRCPWPQGRTEELRQMYAKRLELREDPESRL
ncbi:MAG: SRPBCC family protein [Stackebrandtia sp.]